MLTKLAGCVDIGDNVDADQPRRGEGQTALSHAGAPHTVAVIKRKGQPMAAQRRGPGRSWPRGAATHHRCHSRRKSTTMGNSIARRLPTRRQAIYEYTTIDQRYAGILGEKNRLKSLSQTRKREGGAVSELSR